MRRTASVDVFWPRGQDESSRMVARARDVQSEQGEGNILAEANFVAIISPSREIVALGPDVRLSGLIGERAGGRLRSAINAALPGEAEAGTPLHLLLDDISGANLVSAWAWSLWNEDWLARLEAIKRDPNFSKNFAREDVCSGLRAGSSGLSLAAGGVAAGLLRNPDDLDGWHDFPEGEGCTFRRARRIDVWRETGSLMIDAHFQDSATSPDGDRVAVHEYRISGRADPATMQLEALVSEPRVLPFAECPAAAENARRLIGTPLPTMRSQVLMELKGPVGCTHLNDALRALADVPALVKHLHR